MSTGNAPTCPDPHVHTRTCAGKKRACPLENPCARHVRFVYADEDALGWFFLQALAMFLAEFFGTWLFVLFGITATALDPVGVFAAGLVFGTAYAALGASLGGIGSGHFNPYFSTAFYLLGYMPGGYGIGGLFTLVGFLATQFLGALVAAWTLQALIGHAGVPELGITVPTGFVLDHFWLVVLAEFAATAGLIFIMLQVMRPKRHETPQLGWWLAIGLYIAASLDFLGLVGTVGSMNLFRTLGPAIVTGNFHTFGAYVVGGVFGTVAAILMHLALRCMHDRHCWWAMLEEAMYGMRRTFGGPHFDAVQVIPSSDGKYDGSSSSAISVTGNMASGSGGAGSKSKSTGGVARSLVIVQRQDTSKLK